MADTGFGTTITFDSGFLAEIRSINGPSISREFIDTSHMGTAGGYRTSIPQDLADPGELEVEMLFDPDEEPPIDGAPESVTITWPIPSGGSTAATWVFSGSLVGFDVTAPYDDLMTATARLKIHGAITVTAST